MPGMGFEATVDHGEPHQLACCDELIWDRWASPAVDGVCVGRSPVDHGHTTVEDDREMPVRLADVEWCGCRFAVAKQVEFRPADGVLGSGFTSDVNVRVQMQAIVAIAVEHECHGCGGHVEDDVVPAA